MGSEKKQGWPKNGIRAEDGQTGSSTGEDAELNNTMENIQIIDVMKEVGEDIKFQKDLAIIGRFIGPRTERRKITKWIANSWQTPNITNFLLKGFFIVVFATEEEHQKILDKGLWMMDTKPLYIQKWCRNFNPLNMEPYDKPIWIWLNNLLMEY
ncbi:hypothetical protein SUGI_0166320 [Cryptomeria japonica]|nr:hypothetical protein SUGI_0166320 [Cryptomeria japonica]